jgi:lycopene cyclase domain-containing protein
MYTYLILNFLTISFPLIRSFEGKISYVSKWKYLFPAIFITGILFIIWDHYFTIMGVWRFNSAYITGFHILELPVEEWLFFLTVPFACVFIYEVVKYFVKADPLKNKSGIITFLLIIILLILAITNTDKIYTFTTFSLTALCLLIHWACFKNAFFGIFYITYIFHLIPFLIINGFLTYLPVVIYNDEENLGLRIFSIPVEDTIYSMLLLLINISLYEYFRKRKTYKGKREKRLNTPVPETKQLY